MPPPENSPFTQEVEKSATIPAVTAVIPSTFTPTPQEIKVTATIEQAKPVIQMPILDMNASLETGKFVDSSHKLVGKLYVGMSYTGEYIQFDFDQNRIARIQLPEDCQILATGKEALCQDNDPGGALIRYSLYDVVKAEKQYPFKDDDGKWILTSSGRLIESVDVTGEKKTIKAYDLVTKEVIQIGTFENRDYQYLIPFLSNSGTQMVGVEYGNDPWLLDSRWYFMEKGSMTPESILIPEPLYATTDSIAWAPDDSMVVLLAAWDDVEQSEGPLCGKEILLFDPATQAVESIGEVPPDRCITEFPFYPHQVWSPDGSKLALVLDQQDICIKDLSKKEKPCQVITNNYGSDRYVKGITWSVDSQWLAYMIGDTLLHVYSIQEVKTYIIADFKGVSSDDRAIGLNMVWGR